MRLSRFWFLGLLLLFAAACESPPAVVNPPTFPVSGKVYLNQKPLARALVVFHPVQPPADKAYRCYAHTDADGSFRMSTFAPHDGAPAGRYKVTIQLQDEDNGSVRIPLRFGKPDTSGITVDVKAEPTTLAPFHLRPS